MALIVGAIVNMTSTLPAQADHGSNPILKTLSVTPYTQTVGSTTLTQGTALDLFGVASGSDNPAALTNECHATNRGYNSANNELNTWNKRDYNDTSCTVSYSTDAKEIALTAVAGTVSSTNDDGIHAFADVASTTHTAHVGGISMPTGGWKFDLDEGDNEFTVTVVHNTDPSFSRTYTVTVNRKENSSPYFASSYPAKNNRYVYGYAEDLMEHKGGLDTVGPSSVYNHPSDGAAYDANTNNTWYAKNADRKLFMRADVFSDDATQFTTSTNNTIAFRDIINAGATTTSGAEVTGTTNNAHYLRNTDTVNLSEGIRLTAMKLVGTIDLPMAMGGNPTAKPGTGAHKPYTYELKQVGASANDNDLPDGLTTQYLVWTDVAENDIVHQNSGAPGSNDQGTDLNGDGDKADGPDGIMQSVEIAGSGTEPSGDNQVLVGLRLLSGLDADSSASAPNDYPRTDSNNSADKSVFTLVYRATDGDAVTKSDAAEVVFDVTIQKGLAVVAPPTGDDPVAKNELSKLVVLTTGSSVTNSLYTPRQGTDAVMVPATFDPDVTTYRVSIPYERKAVTINATAAFTSTKLKAITPGGNIKITSGTAFTVPELSQGSNDPPVRIEVTPDADSGLSKKTYTIYISREYNTPAQFDTSNKPSDLNFYDGVPMEPVDLPGGRLGNGDPAPTSAKIHGEWRYDLSLKANYNTVADGAVAGQGEPGWPYASGTVSDNDADRTQNTSDTSGWLPNPPNFDYDVKKRQLTGTPTLADNVLRSSYSDYTMLYVAKDGDLDDTAADNAEHEFNIRVWRNVLLQKLEVDTTPGSTSITPAGVVYQYSSTKPNTKYTQWNKAATYEYSYTVDHNVPQVVVAPTAFTAGNNAKYAAVVDTISPPDANTSTTTRHEVDLTDGNNMVTIEVTNGNYVGTHKLNIYRRPLGANPITVTALAGNEMVKLSPDFSVTETNYTATVESHQDILLIDASAVTHPSAQVSVNYIDTGISKTKEVAADPGENTYRVDVNLGSAQTTYWLRITRKGNVAPSFGSETVASMTKQVGKALVTCKTDGTKPAYIMLPEAEDAGNGASVYSIDPTTLPDGVSFNAATRQLTGTPVLRQAYERSYDIDYVVSDSDTDTTSADTDTITFTMTVTNDTVDPCANGGDATPAAKNLLTDLLVIYDLPALNKTDVEATLMPEFDSAHPTYDVELPHGSTNRRIAAYVNTGASVLLNQVVIPHGVHTPLNQDANQVRVSYPGLPSTNYGLTITEASPSVPALSETVPDQTWQAGKAITAMSLPVATGGNAPLTYSLADHQSRMPSGLSFNAETRVLSGTPSLSNVDSAETAIYVMTYTVVDRDGDPDTDEFRITITTEAQANPGAMPDSLTATKSGTTATLRWNPGDDATAQVVAYLTPSGEIVIDMNVAADANRYTAENLADGTYRYLVVGVDANGMLHFSNPASTD